MFELKTMFGYAHGLFWKVASTLAKLAFLFIIVPWLPDGAYAEYLYGISVTLIPALLLCFSAMDELPIQIRGDLNVMNQFAPLYIILLAASWVAIGLYFIVDANWLLLGAVLFLHATQYVMAGLLRSINPAYYEWIANIPAILFLFICFLILAESGEELLQYFFFTNMAVTMFFGFVGRVDHRLKFVGLVSFFKYMIDIAHQGTKKTISNMLMVLDTRGLIVFPKLFSIPVYGDTLALAITAGETVYQLAMVVVNRNFVRYCNGEGSLVHSLRNAAILLLALGITGSLILLISIPITIPKFDWQLAGWSVIFFAGIIAFMEVRQFLWARQYNTLFIFAAQIGFALIQLFVVLLLHESNWLRGAALTSIAIVFLVMFVTFIAMKLLQIRR